VNAVWIRALVAASRATSKVPGPPAASSTTVTDKPSGSPFSPDFMAWRARLNAGLKAMRKDKAFRQATRARIS
jgi:hypothetical protein